MQAEEILPYIEQTVGDAAMVPYDTYELVKHVINNFLKKKISGKVATKRIAALYGDEKYIPDILTVFQAFSAGITVSEMKLRKQPKVIKSGVWSEQEDQLLINAVHTYGTKNWAKVAEQVGDGRTKSQCAQRWERTLDPTISRDVWSEDEIKLLIEGVRMYGIKSWVKVAKHVGTRSDVQCRYKYKSTLSEDTPRHRIKFTNPRRVHKVKEPQVIEQKVQPATTTEDTFGFFEKFNFNEGFLANGIM